jgi:FkbM family methyltransferase
MAVDWAKKYQPNSFIGFLLRLPLRLIPRRLVIRMLAGPGRGLKWIVGSEVHSCWLGTYELDKQTAIQRLVGSGCVVFDVGANAGFYTLLASRLVGDEGCVYAVEPLACNVQYLMRHIELNGCRNVRIIQAAAGDTTTLGGFSTDRNASMNGVVDRMGAHLIVPVLPIDTLVRDYRFRPPSLIKIDVEGSEASVLAGAAEVLSRYHPAILLALHGPKCATDCRAILAAHDYGIYALDGDALGSTTNDEILALPVPAPTAAVM